MPQPPRAAYFSPTHDASNNNPSVLRRDFLPYHAAGADLLSGFGGEPAAAAATAGIGDVSDMLTMSPGESSSKGDGNGATRKKATGTAADDWLGLGGLAGNGQAAARASAAPAGGAATKASSGTLLDDWAGGGPQKKGATAEAAAVDRSQMLQQKVIASDAV